MNCTEKVEQLNLKGINIDHEATDVECPTYLRVVKEKRKRICYYQKLQLKPDKPIWLCLNAQSLPSNIDQIRNFITAIQNSPVLLGFTETRVTDDIENWEIEIEGYECIRCDSRNRRTGGVTLYVKNDMKIESIVVNTIENNCWFIIINVNFKSYKGSVMVVYHSPNSEDKEFIDFIEHTAEDLAIKGNTIIMGDFNINMNRVNSTSLKLKSALNGLGLKQLVNEPTRVGRESSTIIDLVFSNIDLDVKVYDTPKITDHSWLHLIFNKTEVTQKKSVLIRKRNFKDFDLDLYREHLKDNISQINEYPTSDQTCNKFVHAIVHALDQTAPFKIVKISEKWIGKKWYCDDIKIACQHRDNAFLMAKRTQLQDDWHSFRILRNKVVKLIKKKKKEYFNQQINVNKNNSKQLWKTIKNIIKGDSRQETVNGDLIFDGEDTTYKENDDANNFNRYFVNSIKSIIDNIETNENKNNYCTSDIWCENVLESFELIDSKKLRTIVFSL